MSIKICCLIVSLLKNYGVYEIENENEKIHIFYNPLNEFESDQIIYGSDIVQITAKKHFNENRNITDKIDKANKQLLSALGDHKSIKQLVIRLGATADFDAICRHIDKIAEDWERRGFDFIQVFQPQVVDDIEINKTSICTSVYFGKEMFYPLNSHMKEKIENTSLVRMEFPTNSITTESIPIYLFNDGVKMDVNLSHYYSYQRGDIYIKLKNKNGSYEGNISRVYPGVLKHLVFKNTTISPVIYTTEERLLIV